MTTRSIVPRRSFARRSLPHALLALALSGSATLSAPVARAEFSSAPESPYRYDAPRSASPAEIASEPESPWRSDEQRSTLRFHIGPALAFEPRGPGLFTALDIGRRAVGARVSAAWLRAESERGLAAYDAELWIDLRHRYDLHPIVGAGASLLHGAALGEESSVGAGVLRGALEYELPLEGADARVALNVMMLVPAIGTERTRPWAITSLSIAAGF